MTEVCGIGWFKRKCSFLLPSHGIMAARIYESNEYDGLSLRECIEKELGRDTFHLARKFERNAVQLSKCKNHVVFNLRCKHLGLIPRSLQLSCPVKTYKGRKIVERAGHQLVRERLRVTVLRKHELEDERKWLEIGLKRRMSEERFQGWSALVSRKSEKVFQATRTSQQSKFKKMIVSCDKSDKMSDNESNQTVSKDRWVVNLSDHQLTPQEQSVLEKGLNFALSPSFIPRMDIIAAVEPTLRAMDDQVTAEMTRAKISGLIKKGKRPPRNISKEEQEALSSLRSNEEIVVAPADKGNATVVLNVAAYEGKALDVIGRKPFEQIAKDPTKRVEDGLNRIVWDLFKSNQIKRPLYDFLRASSCPLPRFYGRVKTHKANNPLRPVISAMGTATYNASRYVAGVLAPLVGCTENTSRNSGDFIEQVSGLPIDDNEIMVSFDVSALYTSLPIDRVLEVVRNKLESDDTLSERSALAAPAIVTLLEYCLRSTYFTFRGKFYHLTDGVAMGSPASSVVANVFMEALEQKALDGAKRFGFPPRIWKRYVDDVFSLCMKQHVARLMVHLNEQDENIQFTREDESAEGSLPFLDVSVERVDGKISTAVYRKPTHTDRVLSFSSHHPLSAKRSVVLSLFERVSSHYNENDVEGRKRETEHLHSVLASNGYPLRFIRSTLQQASRKKAQQTKSNAKDVEKKPVVVIPYVQGVSDGIKRVLGGAGVRAVTKAQPWKWGVCSGIKDRIPMDDMKGVVYSVKCKDCEDEYIGETLRSMKVRMKEHERHTRFGRIDESAVAEHARVNDHVIDWAGAKVLDTDCGRMSRRVREALHIAKMQPAMNKDCGVELSAAWLDLVRK